MFPRTGSAWLGVRLQHHAQFDTVKERARKCMIPAQLN